ncbi:CpaF family protein [Photobacterium sp. WH77]|nr:MULTISPECIES: CpaF family protein [Photobacterium]MCG2837852.1 CpaF family protein [Photobacterium sp. WH77]MCG2845470.1 CpaF family protein [Photobacterium sp. WH80]MDO6582261.1 CpaF family protein [Photobacterium sp. 2_MG-2023]
MGNEMVWPSRELVIQQEESTLALKAELHRYIIEQLEEDGLMFEMERQEMQPHVHDYVRQYFQQHKELNQHLNIQDLVTELMDEIVGFGPLQNLLDDPNIDDILINGPKNIYVERSGQLSRISLRFMNDQHVLRVIRRMISPIGRRIDESNPMVDARLPDGSRINAVIPPLSIDGPCLSIRKFKKEGLTADTLIQNGAMSVAMHQLLRSCAKSRFNILISGSTGSGKTTLLNILSQYINTGERIVTIEDAAELQLRNGHVVRLETRPPNSEGHGEVTARDLLKNALRMRPDRIILGESRGGEVLDMLQAMNTGHQGSMSTLHANSPRDALVRLEMMVTLAGFTSTESLIKQIIATALDMIVQVSRLPSGKRVITHIVEVQDVADDQIRIQELYKYNQQTEDFVPVDAMSVHLRKKLEEGL